MRKLILGVAMAGLVFTAVPAFSQVDVEVGPGGVGVGVGRDRDRGYYRDRRYYEDRRDWRRDRYERRRFGERCRTTIIRERGLERRIRRCD